MSFSSLKKHLQLLFILCTVFSVAACKKNIGVRNPGTQPVEVFDELWNFMDKHYALFPQKQVDWRNTYNELRPQANNNLSDLELARLLNTMLLTLKDGHVNLITRSDTTTYTGFYTAYPANFNYRILITGYLNNSFKTAGPVIYKVVTGIGYMYLGSFGETISDKQLDDLFNDLKETKGLIVDVRNNTGGQGQNATNLFSRFLSEKKLVKYEVVKKDIGHSDFFDPIPFYISPAAAPYLKPVALLTNRACFSACNDFVLYMSLLPNVQQVGDQTGGGGGNPYNYILANGWKLQYTGMYSLSPDKKSIELGIAPDFPVEISSQEEIEGRDPIIDRAIELLK